MNSCVRALARMYAFIFISFTSKPSFFSIDCTLMMSGCTLPHDRGSMAVSMTSAPLLHTSRMLAIERPGPLWPWYCMMMSGCLVLMAFVKAPSSAG